jgi:hypothetical protein
VLRRWSRLRNQSIWLGQSTIEINRDSVYVFAKDNSIPLRETLTDDEIRMYASNAYLDHIAKKGSREIGLQHRDPLFETAQSAKPDYTKSKRPERGIKINIGAPSQ